MEEEGAEAFEADCRSGWLLIADDFSSTVTTRGRLKYAPPPLTLLSSSSSSFSTSFSPRIFSSSPSSSPPSLPCTSSSTSSALQCMGRSPSERSLSQHWNKCGGSLTFHDFCEIVRREKVTSFDDLMLAFQTIDTSGDGYITVDELQRMLTKRGEKMTEEEVRMIIEEADENGDGKLDFKEFSKMILCLSGQCMQIIRKETEAIGRERIEEGGGEGGGGGRGEEGGGRGEEGGGGEGRGEEQKALRNFALKQQEPKLKERTKTEAQEERRSGGSENEKGEAEGEEDKVEVEEDKAVGKKKIEGESEILPPTPPIPSREEEVGEGGEERGDEDGGNGGGGGGGGSEGGGGGSEGVHTGKGGVEEKIDGGEGEGGGGDEMERREDEEEEKTESEVSGDLEGEGDGEEATGSRQPNHLAQGTGRKTSPVSAFPKAPRRPTNVEEWNCISGKGCLFLELINEEEALIKAHHYHLTLPCPTSIWLEVGVASSGILATDYLRAMDSLMFIFNTDQEERLTSLVSYTQHKLVERWVCRMDLEPGRYALVPFSSGCFLKPREEDGGGGGGGAGSVALISTSKGRTVLTKKARAVLMEVFQRCDLDSNGAISRMEFDFFQETTTGELCDDEAWEAVQENFTMTTEDELTLEGFLQMHLMAAQDEEGEGEEEVWTTLSAMGYSRQLRLDQACPFELKVFTESCEGEIEIVDILTFDPKVSSAFCQVVVERGVLEPVRNGNGTLFTHTYTTPHLTTIAVENKGSKKQSVQLDLTQCTNLTTNKESPLCVVVIEPHSLCIGFHVCPTDPSISSTLHCVASRILS